MDNYGVISHLRQMFLIPHRINEIMNLRTSSSTSAGKSSNGILWDPGDLYVLKFKAPVSNSNELGLDTGGSAVCIVFCLRLLNP